MWQLHPRCRWCSRLNHRESHGFWQAMPIMYDMLHHICRWSCPPIQDPCLYRWWWLLSTKSNMTWHKAIPCILWSKPTFWAQNLIRRSSLSCPKAVFNVRQVANLCHLFHLIAFFVTQKTWLQRNKKHFLTTIEVKLCFSRLKLSW